MAGFLLALPLQVAGDFLSAFLDILPILVLIIVVAGAMLWILGWMSRYFEYLKTIESTWIDRTTLDFVRRVLEAVWIALMALILLAITQTRSTALRSLLADVLAVIPAAFVFVFVLFIAAIVVRVLHRFAAYLRGELRAKPKRVAPVGALAFAEIVLKYIIYVAALVIAVFGGLRALPGPDQAYIQQNFGTLPAIEPVALLGLLFGLLAIAVADRFASSIVEDMKLHSAKFSLRALDELKSVARYAVWIVGAVVLLFIILSLLLSGDRLVIFAVGFIALMVALALFAFSPVQNALSGFTLLRADPFNVGDRIKVGEDLVGDVVSVSLSLTSIRTLRNEVVQLPNATLLTTPIVNFSRSKPYAVFLEVPAPFDVAHDRVRDLLLQAAAETEGIVRDRPPEVFGRGIRDGAILYQLFAYTDQPERMKEIKSALVFKVQDLLARAGISASGGRES